MIEKEQCDVYLGIKICEGDEQAGKPEANACLHGDI